MIHYIDTSVLAAYYCPEVLSSQIQRMLSKIEAPAISPLVEVELYCAVARKTRAGEFGAAEAHRIMSQFRLHAAEPRFHMVPFPVGCFGIAREWIASMNAPLRVMDGLHLAMAHINGMCMVTADAQLAASAKYFGVKYRLIS